jgi:hypothetical protein
LKFDDFGVVAWGAFSAKFLSWSEPAIRHFYVIQ